MPINRDELPMFGTSIPGRLYIVKKIVEALYRLLRDHFKTH